MGGRDGGRDDRSAETTPDGTPADAARTVVDGREHSTSTDTVVVPDDASGALDTIHVPDDAPGALDTIHVPDDAPSSPRPSFSTREAAPRRRRTVWLAALAVAAFALLSCTAAVAFLAVVGLPDDVVRPERAQPPTELCAGGAPAAAVLARLPATSPVPSLEALRARMGTLSPDSVTVHRLSGVDGRAITLEVSPESWSGWRDAESGASGADRCARVREALAAHGAVAESFYASRAPGTTDARVGTMGETEAAYAAIYDWLEPLALGTRCTLEQGPRGRPTLVVACDIASPRSVRSRVRITPALHRDGVAEPLYGEERVLGPGERSERRYRASGRSDQVGSRCECQVVTLGIERDAP